MKSERTFYRLANVIDLIGGGTPKTSVPEYWDGNIPWLSVKDFNNGDRYVYTTEKSISQAGLDNSSTKLLTHNDIIISARGTVGELAMIPFPMAFNQSCYGIRGKKGIIVQPYLYYLLKNSICLLKSQTHGSVFDTITSVLQKTVVILYRNMLYLEYGKTINSCTGRRKRDTAHGEAFSVREYQA